MSKIDFLRRKIELKKQYREIILRDIDDDILELKAKLAEAEMLELANTFCDAEG